MLMEQIAQYEFCVKPAAAIALIHSSIPHLHKIFWEKKSASDLHMLCYRMTITPAKVLSILEYGVVKDDLVSSYLTTMIGNMQVGELSLFLRFVTGASICIVPEIRVEFIPVTAFWSCQLLTQTMKNFVWNLWPY